MVGRDEVVEWEVRVLGWWHWDGGKWVGWEVG